MTTFGKDISGTSSLRSGRFSTGIRLVAEAAYRRLTTPRGMLFGDEEEANYGLDLGELIGSVNTSRDAAALEGRIKGELEKDERIERATVTVAMTTDAGAVTFLVDVSAETAEGPFELQVGIADVSVELLGIKVAA